MTDITNKIQKIVNDLDEIDEYYDGLNSKLSDIDLKIQDLLHYVENNKINMLWTYNYVMELKRLRLERRQIKNDITILGRYNEHKNKLVSPKTRNFLITELHKTEKQLEKPYQNRQYGEGEIENILIKSNKKE